MLAEFENFAHLQIKFNISFAVLKVLTQTKVYFYFLLWSWRQSSDQEENMVSNPLSGSWLFLKLRSPKCESHTRGNGGTKQEEVQSSPLDFRIYLDGIPPLGESWRINNWILVAVTVAILAPTWKWAFQVSYYTKSAKQSISHSWNEKIHPKYSKRWEMHHKYRTNFPMNSCYKFFLSYKAKIVDYSWWSSFIKWKGLADCLVFKWNCYKATIHP